MARAKGKKAATEEASDDDVEITATGFRGGGYLLPGAKDGVKPFVHLPDSYVRNEDGDPAPILAAEFKKSLRPGDQVFKNVYSQECGACCTRWAWLATRGHRRPPG
eukprot:scaffold136223_cov332-Phaeocystis_antarctica.AAC.1